MAPVTLDSGLRLSYVDRRRVGVHPPVVLLPGPTDSWRSYQPVLDHLTAQTSVVAVSQRGHGDSPANRPWQQAREGQPQMLRGPGVGTSCGQWAGSGHI